MGTISQLTITVIMEGILTINYDYFCGKDVFWLKEST